MTIVARDLDTALRAANIPIDGVSIGVESDRATWVAQMSAGATTDQATQAAQIIATFDPVAAQAAVDVIATAARSLDDPSGDTNHKKDLIALGWALMRASLGRNPTPAEMTAVKGWFLQARKTL